MSPHTIDRIRAAATEGMLPKEIARQLGVPRSEVVAVMREVSGFNGSAVADKATAAFCREARRRREEFQRSWDDRERWLEREIRRWWNDWGRADWEREQRGLAGDVLSWGRRLVAREG